MSELNQKENDLILNRRYKEWNRNEQRQHEYFRMYSNLMKWRIKDYTFIKAVEKAKSNQSGQTSKQRNK